jgi:hypothetical protein
MSTPLGEKSLATVPVPLDRLAADLDRGYEGLQSGQRHRAARYLLSPPLEHLVEFRGVDRLRPDQLACHGDGVADNDPGETTHCRGSGFAQ